MESDNKMLVVTLCNNNCFANTATVVRIIGAALVNSF